MVDCLHNNRTELERVLYDIQSNCGLYFCDKQCQCHKCIKCFGCSACNFGDLAMDFNLSLLEKLYRKKRDRSSGNKGYILQRPLNAKFKRLKPNSRLIYRKKIFYVKSYTIIEAKDRRIKLRIRRSESNHS